MATRSGEVSVAIEGLQDALRQRKATLAEIAHQAEHGGRAMFSAVFFGRDPLLVLSR